MKLDKYAIGKRYGKALFELAQEQDQVAAVAEQLKEIYNVYAALPELSTYLTTGSLEATAKNQLMQALFEQTTGLVHSFLEVVQDHQRWAEVPEMIADYERRVLEAEGTVVGSVKSVVPLSEAQLATIAKETARLLGYKKAKLTNVIDESLIGGIKIEANHFIIDRSLQKRIQKMSQALMLKA